LLSAHPFQFRQPLVDQRRSSLGVFDHEVVHIYAAFQHLLVAKKFECDCAAFCLVSDQVGSFLILNLPLTRIGHQAAVRPLRSLAECAGTGSNLALTSRSVTDGIERQLFHSANTCYRPSADSRALEKLTLNVVKHRM